MSSPAENRPGAPPGAAAPVADQFGALIGGLTHDFNNLFGLIIGNLELLRDPQTTAEESLDFSRDALEAATRGAALTRDLVAFAQRQRLDPQPIDLNDFVTDAVRTLGARLGQRIEIALELAPGLWPVIADPVQLHAALTTLATGAAEAMDKDGRLTISTANRTADDDAALAPGDYATIAVSDNGPGIPPEILGRIFEPFAARGKARGAGLRLGAVFGFMKQSRGHVTVKNNAGTGTTFRLYLPRAGTAAAAGTMRQGQSDEGKARTVLVVDDDPAMRQLAVRHLTALGYGVVEAANAAVAIATLETEPTIDLLFTDVLMPGAMDGLALAGMVVRRWPKVKIVVTSEAATRIAKDDLGTGIRLLPKPYRKDELGRMLHEVLGAGASRDGAAQVSA
jgi:CheY-like chemotaxis protein